MNQYVITPILTRLLRHVEITANGCWVWRGARAGGRSRQYGKMTLPNKVQTYVHRVAWQLYRGKIPKDKEVHHVCKNKLCCNPDHLELVNNKQHSELHQKSHCVRGHEFSKENTYTHNGFRYCRQCRRDYMQNYYTSN